MTHRMDKQEFSQEPIPLPPAELLSGVGSDAGNFAIIGAEFLRHFIEKCGLCPGERVLDVGCGVGRMAIPVVRHLGPAGSYDGFDVSKAAIDWCNCNLAPRFNNSRFHFIDLQNNFYNPFGQDPAARFRFPFKDATFDFIFATSVFTHLLPDASKNYLREIYRVLKPGGRCLATYFLVNDGSRSSMSRGASSISFAAASKVHYVTNPKVPEIAVAYEEPFIDDLYQRIPFGEREKFYGSWSGCPGELTYQDTIIAWKPEVSLT